MNRRLKKLLGWGWETYEDHSLIMRNQEETRIFSLLDPEDVCALVINHLYSPPEPDSRVR